jgi:hypothetical protein
MENEISSRVKLITKRSAKILEENTGVQTQLDDSEVEEYVKFGRKRKDNEAVLNMKSLNIASDMVMGIHQLIN